MFRAQALNDVTLIEFDGKTPTTSFHWVSENDPVMGGLSTSTFTQEDGLGIFNGTVRIVPSLKAPGFCFPHTVGFAKFQDASKHTHLGLTLRSTVASYTNFKVSFAANTLNTQFASFKADFTVDADTASQPTFTTVLIPFNTFSNKWNQATGEPTVKCSDNPKVCPTDNDLAKISQFAFWAEGYAGDFHLEIDKVFATTPSSEVKLVTFDGAKSTTFKWEVIDDPVMGGRSHSTFQKDQNTGDWTGEVAIVPSLKSPGFCTIRTTGDNKFPDVTGTKVFKMKVRNAETSELTQFDLQLTTSGGHSTLKQGTYSGSISVPATGEWQEVSADWSSFDLTWRGEKINGPALPTQLAEIESVGLSTYFPGKAGNFSLDIEYMSAGN